MTDFKIENISLDNHSHYDININFEKVDSFAQRVLLTLNTWKNEFAYDVEGGVDYEAVLNDNFSSRTLEAFFIHTLKEQLKDFSSLNNFVLEFDKSNSVAKVSFIAYSVDNQKATVENFEI